jgi:hypothetical protein
MLPLARNHGLLRKALGDEGQLWFENLAHLVNGVLNHMGDQNRALRESRKQLQAQLKEHHRLTEARRRLEVQLAEARRPVPPVTVDSLALRSRRWLLRPVRALQELAIRFWKGSPALGR